MVTLSIIKADTGGFVGHSAVHPDMLAAGQDALSSAVADGLLLDGKVGHCGDDLSLIMTHEHGADAEEVHSFAWDVFLRTTEIAKGLGLYGAGQDLLSDAFSGNLRGMGPGYAELEFTERPSEPVVCFLADKTEPGAWNLPLYKMFADPFNTAGLVIDAKMHAGFRFEVYDLYEEKRIWFDCPRELYEMLMFIGAPARYVIHSVESKTLHEQAVATSTQRLSLIAGKYVGKDDPVMIVRCQSGLPALGEVLEPFSFAYTAGGCMRGSHHAPMMPVSVNDAHPARFDGPPRVVALGFQVHQGKLIGPRDLFDDPSFDRARAQTNEVMDYLRRHGPFEPHRLPLEDLEYTTMADLEKLLADRWQSMPEAAVPAPR
ncbi:fructose-bisphosphate aldolase /D-fructose 1,6-bisphosphatase [Saccharopolyspora shandongensis]|uniref:Fructose-1,6-bisphosphate aldolase/phosphatase n=1 Tax=Saccharopolyspora shandongensis TaxID=418495 RepID=A0A1H3QWQ1_9PSEU|nr:fructose-1,6-bisphosphate aldolase/phosphatase [Saccharopolyspora shandongensis]SDZ17408.1 fructose-bisphosphate aldolase /D-fructose 1,6-bisphosphatase [Saccharopolyspora shandongensis]